MSEAERHDWDSSEYVDSWLGKDTVEDLLALARRISVGLTADAGVEVERIIDLGSGPGTYLDLFLQAFPAAQGAWMDVSEPMLHEAEQRLLGYGDRVTFTVGDVESLADLDLGTADVVLTSRTLHHCSAETIRGIYATVAGDLLRPGGWFFNLDHFASPDDWESRYWRVRDRITGRNSGSARSHTHAHPFQHAADHVEWLHDAGFATVDMAWKAFFSTLLVARKDA